MIYYASLWSFLNNSLPSSIIGGVVAGLIVGLALYLWTGNRTQRDQLTHVEKILKQDIGFNLSVIRELREHLKTHHLPTFPVAKYPLKMSSIKVAASETYIQVMKPDMAILVSTLFESGNQLNDAYNYIKSTSGTPNQRSHFIELSQQFPDLLSIVEAAMTSLNGELKQ